MKKIVFLFLALFTIYSHQSQAQVDGTSGASESSSQVETNKENLEKKTTKDNRKKVTKPTQSKIITDTIPDTIFKSVSVPQASVSSPTNETQVKPKPKHKPFDFWSVSFITIGLYLFTMLLVKTQKIKKITHRKIWNLILLISFLVSGILGLVLVVQINYGIGMSAFRDFLYLHVEFGIVMAIIAIIHAFWHLSYYITLFAKNKEISDK